MISNAESIKIVEVVHGFGGVVLACALPICFPVGLVEETVVIGAALIGPTGKGGSVWEGQIVGGVATRSEDSILY